MKVKKRNRSDPSFTYQPESRKARRDFGAVIRKYREIAGLSMAQLSEDFGFGRNQYRNWEVGVSKPPLNLVIPLCSYLHIPLEEFFGVPSSGDLSPVDRNLLDAFHNLSEDVQQHILFLMSALATREAASPEIESETADEVNACNEMSLETGEPASDFQSNVDLQQHPTEGKRKRGRPRKYPIVTDAVFSQVSEGDNLKNEPPVDSGSQVIQQIVISDVLSGPVSNADMSDAEISLETQQVSAEKQKTLPEGKRKRGRPRKNPVGAALSSLASEKSKTELPSDSNVTDTERKVVISEVPSSPSGVQDLSDAEIVGENVQEGHKRRRRVARKEEKAEAQKK